MSNDDYNRHITEQGLDHDRRTHRMERGHDPIIATPLPPQPVPRQYKVEVIADNSGKWCGNGLTFETRIQAEGYGMDLASRWTLVREWRVVEVMP